MSITEYTGIRCTACKVFFHKIVDHKIAKLVANVQDKMRKAVLHGGHAGIIKAIKVAAAGFFLPASTACIIPGFHSDPDYFITFIMKHQGGNSTVDSATHCH